VIEQTRVWLRFLRSVSKSSVFKQRRVFSTRLFCLCEGQLWFNYKGNDDSIFKYVKLWRCYLGGTIIFAASEYPCVDKMCVQVVSKCRCGWVSACEVCVQICRCRCVWVVQPISGHGQWWKRLSPYPCVEPEPWITYWNHWFPCCNNCFNLLKARIAGSELGGIQFASAQLSLLELMDCGYVLSFTQSRKWGDI